MSLPSSTRARAPRSANRALRSADRARVLLAVALCLMLAAASHAQKKRILVMAGLAPDLAELAQAHPEVELVAAKPDELAAKIVDCEAVIGLGPGPKLAEIVKAGKNLKWIQASSAGAEEFVALPGLVDSPVVLTNSKILLGPGVADHAMALLLNLTRDMKWWNEQMKVGFVQKPRLPLIELQGKTALVVGFGGIGHQVAQRAAGFGMRVLAIDVVDMPPTREVEYIGQPEDLDRLLPEADVLFLTVPLTKQTTGMIGQKQFDLMKKGSYLVNVARGAVVDTPALLAALQSGKLAAAGLDVVEPEPLAADHPLWSMQNVTISPHAAGQMDGLRARQLELYKDNLERYLSGKPMRNLVDKKKGF
jgi:phosphoglycerate dehydrogenase-like enzyme